MPGSPRVRDLLGEAQKALALKTRLLALGQDPSEVDEALEGLYRDLGHALVHGGLEAMAHAQPFAFPRPPTSEEERFTDEVPDSDVPDSDVPDSAVSDSERQRATRDGWFGVDESEDDVHPREPTLPLFEPGDLAPGEPRLPEPPPGVDLDDSTPVMPPVREFTAEEPADFLVASLGTFSLERDVDDGSPFGQLHGSATTPWRPSVDELMALLVLPANFADADELAIEASRVQWATTNLEARLSGMPTEIRIGFVALLGARAQLLRARLDVDVGPRLSLDRLQRYRIDHDLPTVGALLPIPRPERGSWEEDARQWWALLGGTL